MTIIEPNKNKYYTSEFFYLLIFILIAAISSIFIYNTNVNIKYQISLDEKSIQNLESSSADFRNELYKTLDAANLSALATKENLIQDKNPSYFEYQFLATR